MALRTARGWSRETLGRKSETAPLTILRAELHNTDPALSTVTRWAEALDVTVADLIDDDGPAAA